MTKRIKRGINRIRVGEQLSKKALGVRPWPFFYEQGGENHRFVMSGPYPFSELAPSLLR